MHPATKQLLRGFWREPETEPAIQSFSLKIGELAHLLAKDLPENAEATVALRKLLECKDAVVRSVIFARPE